MTTNKDPTTNPSSGEVTELLRAWTEGKPEALERLFPLILEETHNVARRLLSMESKDNTLQPTELVNEAYLRLVDRKTYWWRDRVQFFSSLAEVMRRILVDRARRRHAAKRGAGAQRLTLNEGIFASLPRDPELLRLDDALKALKKEDPESYRSIMLSYFIGLTQAQIAKEVGISVNTVARRLQAAKLWLEHEMEQPEADEEDPG